MVFFRIMQIGRKYNDILIGVQMALRAAVGATGAVVLAQLLRLEYPIYAMISAVIVTDLDPSKTSQLGLQRLLATVVGASFGALLCQVLRISDWAMGGGIMATILICHILRVGSAAKVAGYVCGIVVLSHAKDAWSYALYRFIETLLGIGMAWAASLVPKMFRIEPIKPVGE
jgi:uncharacterized membrane protein YgaE (UPF0421/DUF939 family)